MKRILGWLNSRTGRLLTHSAVLAVFAGYATWLASGGQLNKAAFVAASIAALHTFLRLAIPVPAPSKVRRRRIKEKAVAGKRLGRHVEHDPRSLNYLVEADGTVQTRRWSRVVPVLDQGQVGSCTANAAVGALGTQPDYATLTAAQQGALNETFALSLYSAEEVALGYGPYPPNDQGGSGLAIAKVCQTRGLISGYTHITSVAAAQTAIQTGPFIVGSNWYTGMDTPTGSGLVTATGTIRGGHEYECIGYNTTTDLWEFVNSWGTSYGVEGHFFYSSATFAKLLSEQGDATVLLPLPVAPVPVDTDPADKTLAVTLDRFVKVYDEPKYLLTAIKAWLTAKNL